MEHRYEDPTPQRFILERTEDETGISGTGKVASGVCWPDGQVTLWWNTSVNSTGNYPSIEALRTIHGHDGRTQVVWVDGALTSDELVYSNTSIGNRRLTWKEVAETNRKRLDDALRLCVVVQDLDRCEHGRHEGDVCGNCDGPSKGNPVMRDDRTIGYNISAKPYRVPENFDTSAWEAWQPK